ncbi:MAG TPA: FKBP-type peptidyl-prolyl cis-trans isomerase [Saprospiraceae bacterium]|nr:FKBP-type peptidyl-prolyl cis-trans isomerase [Saprospiraceae bacterium]
MIKQVSTLFFFILLVGTSVSGQQLTNNMDSVSYGFGVLIAKNLQQQGVDSLDVSAFSTAVDDVLKGNDLKMDAETANQAVQEYMQGQQEKMNAGAIQAGKDFLAENAKREEVKVTDSGLQYEVLTPGVGAKPSKDSQVTVHYTGKLADGKVFDSSVERGEPATFGVTQVIPGWTEALQLMGEGAKWRLYIPYDLAYGPQGAGQGAIPPYATLIFEVELIKVQ